MLEATKAVDGGAGVLHIVKNYTGDVLNFEMAAELAQGEGIEVEAVVINDDVAVQDSLYTAGRRGVGATVLAEKICGAAAEEKRSLAEVTELCRKVNANSRSMGMALTPCITPASGSRASSSTRTRWRSASASTASRAATARRSRPRPASSSGSRRRSSRTCRTSPATRCSRSSTAWAGRRWSSSTSSTGSSTFLTDKGITITRNLIGNYITSLEMAGCSITLLKLDDELTGLWDAPVDAPALNRGA